MPSGSDPARASLAAHTLVIPTYNRAALLRRLVTFYAGAAPDLSLLILDSSRPEVAAENGRLAAEFSGTVRHVTFPDTTPMAAKLRDGLDHVTTATASFCADDDVVFPDGLAEAIAILHAEPGYVSAHGLYINFGEHGHRIHVMREYANPSNEAAHPGARVFHLCRSYESIFYGVFRTPDLRDVFRGVAAVPTLHFQELFQSCAVLLKGKVKRFPSIYAARRSGPAAEPTRDKWQTYYWFAENPTEIAAHYVEYRDALWRFYERHGQPSNLDRAAFDKVMDLSHAVYFSRGCPPAYFHSVLQPLWPDDPFVKHEDDLFRVIAPLGGKRPLARAERLVFRVLRRLRAIQRPRRRPAGELAAAIAEIDAEVATAGKTAWQLDLSPGLRWLAGNDDFRARYRELCLYLDGAPA